MPDLQTHVTVTVDEKLLKALHAANEEIKALRDKVSVQEQRLDHMQERLSKFGARLRHVEFMLTGDA